MENLWLVCDFSLKHTRIEYDIFTTRNRTFVAKTYLKFHISLLKKKEHLSSKIEFLSKKGNKSSNISSFFKSNLSPDKHNKMTLL